MMIEEIAVKRCPFCGCEPRLMDGTYLEYEKATKRSDGYYDVPIVIRIGIECNNDCCDIRPDTALFPSLKKAAEIWNTRASDD
jgi:hypothetical protein